MNTTTSSSTPSKTRFIQNLADTPLFQGHQHAFHALTGLQISLRQPLENEHELHEPITARPNGVTLAYVPARIGKNVIAIIETSPARLNPPGDAAFHDVARTMLDKNHSAADIRAAKSHFDSHPLLDATRFEASLTVLRSFAAQLGEAAHRTLFANTTCEPETIRKAKVFIHDHLTENLSLDTVAAAANISSFHFCKLFKRATGLTFTDFVNHARVEKARRMLMRPASRITEVAYDVGFQSLSHFNRSFRRITAESPTEFRSRLKTTDTDHALLALR